jgi:transcriptional regulator with XRE-family HTH domain
LGDAGGSDGFVDPDVIAWRRGLRRQALRPAGGIDLEERELTRLRLHSRSAVTYQSRELLSTRGRISVVTGAQIIREARLKAGLTQSELAERLGRDRAQVARWETGGQEPSFENLQSAVEACGFTLSIEIAEQEETPALDAELDASLPQAPQQRVQALLERLGGGA